MFIRDDEAVAGALVRLDIEQIIHPVHLAGWPMTDSGMSMSAIGLSGVLHHP